MTTIHSVAGPPAARRGPRPRRGRSARRITPARTSRSSAAAAIRGPASSAWRTTACCFSTSCPEFSRRVLETLRQPLEQRVVHIARAARAVTFPAQRHARRRDEPVPLRVSRQRPARCRCPPSARRALPAAAVGSAAGSLRPRRRPAGGAVGGDRHAAPREATRPSRARVVDARRRQMDRQGCAERRPRGPRSSSRCCASADAGRRKPSRTGRPPVRIKRPGHDARITGSPDRRRPRGTSVVRATWQKPCSFACRSAVFGRNTGKAG